jgi:predicted  nucleic acid-binding Zn-ribbon protein
MILRILAVVAAIASTTLFFYSKGKLAEQQAVAQKAEQATVAVKAELTAANEQINALEDSLKKERDALANEKRKLESMRSEMYTASQEVSRKQRQVSEAKKSIAELESTTKRLRSDLLKSEQSIADTSKEDEVKQLIERVAELEKSNADLKESLEDTEVSLSTSRAPESPVSSNKIASIATPTHSSDFTATKSHALPPTSNGAETTIESLSATNGLIALTNSPELGLSPGITVTIVKKLKALGKVQVSQVTDDLILANLLPGAKTREMVAGTKVSLLR